VSVSCIQPVLIKFKRGLQVSIDNFIPDSGQVLLALDTKRIFVGDQSTPSGNDILIGNVSNLDKSRYYGSNERYIRGFHDLPFVVNIGPYDVDILGTGTDGVICTSYTHSSGFINTTIPILQFKRTANQFIRFTFKKIPAWNPDKELRIRIVYFINPSLVDDYTIRLKTRIKGINLKDDPSFTLGLGGEADYSYEDVINISKTINWPGLNAITLSNAKIKLRDLSNKEYEKIDVEIQRDWENDTFPTTVNVPWENYATCFGILNIQIYQPINGTENAYLMGGGDMGGSAFTENIEKLNFPFENALTYVISTLNSSKKQGGGCNSTTYGYSMGGTNEQLLSAIEKLNFSFDTLGTQLSGNLSEQVNGNSAFNCSSHGFSVGGIKIGSNEETIYTNEIEKIPFNIDTIFSKVTASLIEGIAHTNCVNSSSTGFVLGGYNSNLSPYGMSKTVEKLEFPGDSGRSMSLGELSILDEDSNDKGFYGSQTCNSSSCGYMISGFKIRTIYEFPFETGPLSGRLLDLAVSSYKVFGGGCNSSEYGFSSSGYTTGSAYVSYIDRLNFAMPGSSSAISGYVVGNYGNSSVCDGTDFLTLFA